MRRRSLAVLTLLAAGCGAPPPRPDDAPERVRDPIEIGRHAPIRVEEVWTGLDDSRQPVHRIGYLRTSRVPTGGRGARTVYQFLTLEGREVGHMLERGDTFRYRYDRHLERDVHEAVGSHSIESAARTLYGLSESEPLTFVRLVGREDDGAR